MRYFYKDGGFYIEGVSQDIPTDAVEISKETYDGLFESQAEGGVIGSDEKGYPIILPPVKLTQEQQVAIAESKKQAILDLATQKIAPLQDAVDLDMATDDEKTQLTAWKKYRVLVNRVDTSTAPDITWPISPDDESTTSSSTDTTKGDATTS